MKRWITAILICCLLLGMFPVWVSAKEIDTWDPFEDPLQSQIIMSPRFEPGDVEVIRDDLLLFRSNGKQGMMDLLGNVVLEPVYDRISHVSDGYYAVVRGNATALFYYEKRLSAFYNDIVEFEVRPACIRAKTLSEEYMFFSADGNIISLPHVEETEWQVFDVLPGKALILWIPGVIELDPSKIDIIIKSYSKYCVVDWQGNEVYGDTYSKISFEDDNSFSLTENNEYKRFYLNEEPGKAPPSGYYESLDLTPPNALYRLLYRTENDRKIYCLFDREFNFIKELKAHPDAREPIVTISDTHFLVRDLDGDSLVMNYLGEEITKIPGAFVTFVGVKDKWISGEKLDYFLSCDGVNSYLYTKDFELIASIQGAVNGSNKGQLFTLELKNGNYALYDLTGKFLFGYGKNSGISIQNGVILKRNSSATAILDRSGKPITAHQYVLTIDIGLYGLIYATHVNNKGYYLINAAGEVLNTPGYDSIVHSVRNTILYEQGGKLGVLRIVRESDHSFLDVPEGMWYSDSVNACVELGLFNGIAPGKFAPDDTMTRAMLVTVLWRLDGEQSPLKAADFTDVSAKQWYAQAVAWASENGIVNGVGNGRFDPDGTVTREQIATILHRYAVFKGVETGNVGDLSQYPDRKDVSTYARTALAWANGAGLINGVKTGGQVLLQPKGNATRAQVATILIRYLENLT